MISYEISREDLRYVQRRLKRIETEAPKAFKNAINHTAKEARKKLAAGAQGAYTVKNGGFNSRMRIQNATNTKLYAVIRSKDKPLTITRFHATAPKSGGKADIVKSGLKELIGPKQIKAFKRGGLIMQRKSADRYPVKVLRSVSVPKMLEKVYEGERGIEGALGPEIQRTLHDEIRKEVRKLI
ncbi:MAG: hypothetical protein HFH32_08495 [Eubacterium sp.]|jgi:hypothetical protein|nr:hypothetical protein [Eubacterium sp.]